MMKNLSEEIINIKGVDYTLFLNRKGILAWEKYAGEENQKMGEIEDEASKLFSGKNAEIKKNTNPFEDIDEPNTEENNKVISSSYRKLYWLMLYENHKLDFDEANKLYDEAVEEYGEAQLLALAVQMIKDANSNKVEEKETKKLPALRPSKR